jgi:hypothetical protein
MSADVDTSGRLLDTRMAMASALAEYGMNIPAAERTAMSEALARTSPVDCVTEFATAGYAALKSGGITDAATLAACAQVVGQGAYHVIANGFGHIAADTAQGYYLACRRWLGATVTPDPSADPPIPAAFLPAPQPLMPSAPSTASATVPVAS